MHAARAGTRVVALLATLGALTTLHAPGDHGRAAATAGAKTSTPSLSTTTQTFIDAARQRTLVTTVMTARHATGPSPLLIFIHGYDQGPSDYTTLLRAWAAAGYVVAAPKFPLTSRDATSLDATDYRNEPADVTFLISQLEVQSAAPIGPLSGKVDAARVGVAGHSLGAEVVLGLLNRCCRDPRIRAAVSLAGSEQFDAGTPAFPTDGYFAGAPVPLLLVHGDADHQNPYDRSVTAFAGAAAPKFFETIHGGNHRAPYEESISHPAARVVTTVTVDFLDDYLKGQPATLGRLVHDGAVTGVATLQAVPS